MDEDLRHDEMDKQVQTQLSKIVDGMVEQNELILSNMPDSYTRLSAETAFNTYIKWLKFGFDI